MIKQRRPFPGKLTLICGPMFSGKTTYLLDLAWLDLSSFIMVKPSFDTRFSATHIVDRNGGAASCLAVTSWPKSEVDGRQTIYIDELQFFAAPHYTGDILGDIEASLRDGHNVVACGLDLDYLGQPFSTTARVAQIADQIHKLTADCNFCTGPASMTVRVDGGRDRLQLGNHETYKAACSECFEQFCASPRSAKEPHRPARLSCF